MVMSDLGYPLPLGLASILPMPNAFVILFHTGYGSDHLDLLLDIQGGSLAAWRLAASGNDIGQAAPIAAIKLPDHRREYLQYEGPISRGRGQVRRIDQGSVEVVQAGADRLVLQFAGTLLAGQYVLDRRQDGNWAFSRKT